MDERTIEAPPQRIIAPGDEASPDVRTLSMNGGEIRFDPPHISSQIGNGDAATSSGASRTSSPSVVTTQESPPRSGELASTATVATPTTRASAQLQRETGRIFEQIQSQLADLAKREDAFEERLAAFDLERRQYQSRRDSEEAALEDRRLKLGAGEAELAQRLTDTRALLAQIESARLTVELERSEIENRRAALRDEVLAELQQDRQAVDADKLEAATQLERSRTLVAELEDKQRQMTIEAEQLLQAERERLWQTLIAEWEQRRSQFQQEHDAWKATVDAERIEIEREKAFYEAAVRNLEADFAATRDAQDAELRAQRDQHLHELNKERTEFNKTLAAERTEFQAELQRQQAARQAEWVQQSAMIQAEREQWNATLARQQAEAHAEKQRQKEEQAGEREEHTFLLQAERAEWDRTRAALQIEFETEKQQQIAALKAEWGERIAGLETERIALQSERDEWNKARALQSSEIQGERSVLENRIRFQQDHLEKLRSDLEKSQNEHRRERQIERQRLEEDSIQLLRRMRQIDLYRSSIDEREKSLDREHATLEKSRRALSNSLDMDRLNLQREQSAWQAERQIQQGELVRQQELYSSHMDSLESRRIRLEKLRTELEDTHRSTLEMRLAVEEAWVELTQRVGQDAARDRVEQVRSTLVGYYRQLHEGLVEQRREHLEAQTKLERLRAEFHDERQKLMEWISSRDQELRVGEERLRLATADAATRDSTWQTARDRWMQEKAEAEQVIRKLLGELGSQHRDPAMSLPAELRPPITIQAE